jgi:hypothetical protein
VEAIPFDRLAQWPTGSDQLFLADDLVQPGWPHAVGERSTR